MTILQSVVDQFRNTGGNKVDKYGIVQPMVATADYVAAAKDLIPVAQAKKWKDLLQGRAKPLNTHVAKGVEAYKAYVKHLPHREQEMERTAPFSSFVPVFVSIAGNIDQIEDSFTGLFGLNTKGDEATIRSSSLLVIGYLEKADRFATWFGSLVEHLSATDQDLVSPFRTKELVREAQHSAEFAAFNTQKWDSKSNGLINEVKSLQSKGLDLVVNGDGLAISSVANDSQFTPMQQELISASFRSPISIFLTHNHVRAQERIDLLTSRKDWLTAKIVLEQARLRNMDENSVDYRRIAKAVVYYADQVSRLEQKIERIRA